MPTRSCKSKKTYKYCFWIWKFQIVKKFLERSWCDASYISQLCVSWQNVRLSLPHFRWFSFVGCDGYMWSTYGARFQNNPFNNCRITIRVLLVSNLGEKQKSGQSTCECVWLGEQATRGGRTFGVLLALHSLQISPVLVYFTRSFASRPTTRSPQKDVRKFGQRYAYFSWVFA